MMRGALFTVVLLLCGCQEITNGELSTGQSVCQEYYEACINPLLTTPFFVPALAEERTCAAVGCHNVDSGSGGSFKLFPRAGAGSIQMAANFISAKSYANITDPAMSRILLEPLAGSDTTVGGHGGGDLFPDSSHDIYQELFYWISNPQVFEEAVCPSLDHFPNDANRRCLAD